LDRLAAELQDALLRAGRTEEVQTAALLPLHVRAALVERFQFYPTEDQSRLLQLGLESCEDAIELAEALDDQGCAALYLDLAGRGYYHDRNLEAARSAYGEALAIQRGLAADQPQVYRPDVAATLNNLGIVLSDLRELDGSRRAYEEALAIRRGLAADQPQVYQPDVAATLNNLGTVLRDLRELDGSRRAFEEALGLYRGLAADQPQVYQPNVATTLNNLGNVLRNLRELDGSWRAYEEALAIQRGLAADQPQVYQPDVAGTLNNLGSMLRDLSEPDRSRRAFEEALGLYRGLAADQPQAYQPNVAMTLHNLGLLFRALDDLDAARDCFREAAELYDRHALWLDSAWTHCTWGQLEEQDDHDDRALPLYEAAVTRCDHGLSLLAEHGHRDLFKTHIEPAYLRLIDHHATQAVTDRAETAPLTRLVGLLESLRQVETLTGLGATAGAGLDAWQAALDDLLANRGPLAERFRRDRLALLWVHSTPPSRLVFVALQPGRGTAETADITLVEAFWRLFDEVERANEQWRGEWPQRGGNADRGPAEREAERQSSAVAYAHLERAGEAVFSRLPPGVQALLTGGAVATLFLAPCEATINLPFELLRTPGDDGAFIGLRHLLPRVQGLTQLVGVLQRPTPPERVGSRRAVVVGNPLHVGLPPLEGAEMLAQALGHELARCGFVPQMLIGAAATSAAVVAELRSPDVGLWIHLGHGVSREGAAESLALAGTDRLEPFAVARLALGAARANVVLVEAVAQLRQILPRERQYARPVLRLKGKLPALGGLHRVAGTEHEQIRNCAQRGKVLDGLMRRPVFAETD
jgi:tetratricopeptide (TPR) repeat protein